MTRGSLLMEIAAAGALMLSYPLERIARSAPNFVFYSPEEPVILIHGYGGARSNLLALASYLRISGMDNISYFEYPPTRTIAESARALSVAIDEIAGRKGGVHLVGHSLGGTIARAYAVFARRGAVRSLVTLGSPYLPGMFGRHELAIFGAEDAIVKPPWRVSHTGSRRCVVIESTGHLALAFHPEVMRMVATELRANRVSVKNAA